MESLILIVPLFIAVTTELAKQIPLIPVSSKNAKVFALALAVFYVGISRYSQYQATGLSITGFDALTIAGEIVAIYAVAVGLYETLKKYFKRAENWVK